SVTITGLPSGATLTAGSDGSAFSGSSFTLSSAALNSLTLHAGEDGPATALTVVASNSEGGGASTAATITLSVSPTAETPTLSAPASLGVNENGAVTLGVTVSLLDALPILSVTITGLPSGATLTAGSDGSAFS